MTFSMAMLNATQTKSTNKNKNGLTKQPKTPISTKQSNPCYFLAYQHYDVAIVWPATVTGLSLAQSLPYHTAAVCVDFSLADVGKSAHAGQMMM